MALLSSLSFAAVFMAGCAHPTAATGRNNDATHPAWTGRLSLQVHSEPPQAFFAGFELKGNPAQGELTLSSPLGNSLAVLRWSPQEAVLDSGNQVQRFASVDELIETATGAAIPLPALFDWLGGRNTAAGGWSADLSQQADGRISASRTAPQPRTDLRVVLTP
jgi:outer membrane lipoprotein LolB